MSLFTTNPNLAKISESGRWLRGGSGRTSPRRCSAAGLMEAGPNVHSAPPLPSPHPSPHLETGGPALSEGLSEVSVQVAHMSGKGGPRSSRPGSTRTLTGGCAPGVWVMGLRGGHGAHCPCSLVIQASCRCSTTGDEPRKGNLRPSLQVPGGIWGGICQEQGQSQWCHLQELKTVTQIRGHAAPRWMWVEAWIPQPRGGRGEAEETPPTGTVQAGVCTRQRPGFLGPASVPLRPGLVPGDRLAALWAGSSAPSPCGAGGSPQGGVEGGLGDPDPRP